MRIVSWNIRAGGGKRATGVLAQLLEWQPDVIGLSEFRGTSASQWLASELHATGYCYQLSSMNSKLPAKNALLLASRYPLRAINSTGMPRVRERWLMVDVDVDVQPALTLGLMQVPNYTAPALK